jgi:hypothetical protein
MSAHSSRCCRRSRWTSFRREYAQITKGYDKEKLYQSKTPRKGDEEEAGDQEHRPKLCEKSKYIDQIKKRQEIPRYDMLNRIVSFSYPRARNTLNERKEGSERKKKKKNLS